LPPIIYGDGEQRRCFSPIDDCVSCLAEMATNKAANGMVINIGPDGDGISINELARICQEIVGGPKLDPIYVPDRPREVKQALCSSKTARFILGYEPKKPLRECLEEMAAAIKPKPFNYHLPLEIINDKTPVTWRERRI
jgi:UDP-glucose 4-epimerase